MHSFRGDACDRRFTHSRVHIGNQAFDRSYTLLPINRTREIVK